MNKPKKPIFNLDPEEQELSDSYDRDEWVRSKTVKKEIVKAKKAALKYLNSNTNQEVSSKEK